MNALIDTAHRALTSLGYSDELIVNDYPVWRGQRDIIQLDVAAFAAPPIDMTTATIIVEASSQFGTRKRTSLYHSALALAAPVVMHISEAGLQIFAVSQQTESLALIDDISIRDVERLSEYRKQLGPEPLLAAKWGMRQLSLFPVDLTLLSSATKSARNQLSVRIESSLQAIADTYGESGKDTRQNALRSSRLIVGALTCAFMRDKQGIDLPAETLPDVAQQRYPKYFGWLQQAPNEHDLLVAAIREVSDGISYRGIASAIVSEVYESVLVNDAERRELGIHYTPPEIARLVMQALPVEELEPTRRSVLDPACGSGTLLLAAYDRLRSLQPATWSVSQRHDDLTIRLRGYDRDPFAVQITKLALLLHDLSGGNGWNIETRDSLQREKVDHPASVIITNPPWLLAPGAVKGKRGEQADEFIRHVLATLPDNGLLGLILPSAWLSSNYSREVRHQLTNQCDTFEVWRLPEDVFRSARVAPAVICARKRSHGSEGRWRIFRRITERGAALEQFYETGIASEVQISEASTALTAGPLTAALSGRSGYQELADLVDISVGPQPTRQLTAGRPTPPGTHLWLPKAGFLPAFGYPPVDRLVRVRFPDDFHRRSPVKVVASPKVLVSKTRWAENPWRLKVGIDLTGVIASNSLFSVIPKPMPSIGTEDALFAFMALLGSGVASLWVDEHATKRSANKTDLLGLPIPPNTDWPTLASLGRQLVSSHADANRLEAATRKLESYVWQLYGLPDDVSSRLIARLSAAQPPEHTRRYPEASSIATNGNNYRTLPGTDGEKRIGAVLEVRFDRVLLWVNTVTPMEGISVPVPKRFPGALLHEDATFETDATTIDALPNARYWLQKETWRDDEQLDTYLAE